MTISKTIVSISGHGVSDRWIGDLGGGEARNCRMVTNVALYGGGAYINGDGTLRNCTVADNRATKGGSSIGGGGIRTGGNGTLYNVIIWSNCAKNGANYDQAPAVAVRCDTTPAFGGNNIGTDPRFLDWDGRDFRLATNSPCTGWAMTSNDPGSGVGTSMTMTLTNHAALQWTWSTNVQFTAAATANGGVTGDPDGWYALGGSVTVTAVPDAYYHFAGWNGNVPGGQTNDNPLTLTLDRACDMAASFDENRTTNTDTPEWWLASHGLTNASFEVEAVGDTDHDGLCAWEEHVADTDPTNRASALEIEVLLIGSGQFVTFASSTSRVYTLQATVSPLHPGA